MVVAVVLVVVVVMVVAIVLVVVVEVMVVGEPGGVDVALVTGVVQLGYVDINQATTVSMFVCCLLI